MGVSSVTPSSVISAGANWTIGGGSASHNAAQADSSDATMSTHGNVLASDALILALGNPTIPANAQIRSVQLINRMFGSVNTTAGAAKAVRASFRNGSVGATAILGSIAPTASVVEYGYPAQSSAPGALSWTTTRANDLQLIYLLDWINTPSNADFSVTKSTVNFVYNEAPVVSNISPSGVVTDNQQPTISWTYTDPDGDAQERYWVKIFTATQRGLTGFNPDTTEPVWNSGEIYTSLQQVNVAERLTPGVTYYIYLKVADAGSGGRYCPWDHSTTFSVSLLQLNLPQMISVVGDAANGRNIIRVNAHNNLLSKTEASFEIDLGDWSAIQNSSIATTTAQTLSGLKSMAITATSASQLIVRSRPTSPSLATQKTYTGRVYGGFPIRISTHGSFRASIASAPIDLEVQCYDIDGLIVATFTRSLTANNTGWTTGAFTDMTVTDGSSIVEVGLRIKATVASGTVIYADQMGVFIGYDTTNGGVSASTFGQGTFGAEVFGGPAVTGDTGAVSQWYRGGFAGYEDYTLYRIYEDGTEDLVRIDYEGDRYPVTTDLYQQFNEYVEFYDYEVPLETLVSYRVETSVFEDPNTIGSVTGSAISGDAEVPLDSLGRWWFKLPLAPAYNFLANPKGPTWARGSEEDTAVYKPIGRNRVIVLTDQIYGDNFGLTFLCTNQDEVDDVVNIRLQQKTMLVQDPIGRSWYVRSTGGMAINEIFVSTTPYQEITLHFEEVDAP